MNPSTTNGPQDLQDGSGFDSDKDFKNFQMLEMGGDFELDN
jgi:hypothetical protein